MKPIRLAVIGAGLIGAKHTELITKHEDVELVGICDVDNNLDKLARKLKVSFYNQVEDLLESQKPDGVIISTPNDEHESVVEVCAKNKVDMLIEKPIADTISSADRIIKIVDEEHVNVLIGHHRRHSSLIKKTRLLIQNGTLGKLIGVSMLWTLFKPDKYFKSWYVLINLIHELDLLRYLCGEIVEVYAKSSSSIRKFEVEDSLNISVEFANGAVGNIFASDTTPSPWSYEANTHENKHYYPTDENCYYFFGTSGSLGFPKMELWNYTISSKSGWQHPLNISYEIPPETDPLLSQLDHFCDVIKGKQKPITSCLDGKKSLSVVLSVIESIDKKIPVQIKLS